MFDNTAKARDPAVLGHIPASFWGTLSLCYPWCNLAADDGVTGLLSSNVVNGERPWEGTGAGLFPVGTHLRPY